MSIETDIEPDIRAQPRSRRIAALAERQHGVVARRQLVALGVGRRAIGHAVEAGRWHVWYRGVYAVGHRSLKREGRWMAAVLAVGPGAVLSLRSAPALWGIRPAARRGIEVSVGRNTRGPGGVEVFEDDRARDRSRLVAGWRTIRVTWRQLQEQPRALAKDLRTS